jgi:hypothetical protein
LGILTLLYRNLIFSKLSVKDMGKWFSNHSTKKGRSVDFICGP